MEKRAQQEEFGSFGAKSKLVNHPRLAFSKYIFINEPEFRLEQILFKQIFLESFYYAFQTTHCETKTWNRPHLYFIMEVQGRLCTTLYIQTPFLFIYAQQPALYEAQKLSIANSKKITNNFGNTLRKFPGHIMKRGQTVNGLKQRIEKANCSKNQINDMIRTTITVDVVKLMR